MNTALRVSVFLFVIGIIMFASCTDISNDKSIQVPESESKSEQKKEEPVSKQDGYQYEQSGTQLSGKLDYRVYWGPPGYGEDTLTDMKEPSMILILNQPISIEAEAGSDFNLEQKSISEIQLLTSEELFKHAGETVEITGKLFGAQTGHHHTAVLMEVEKWSPTSK